MQRSRERKKRRTFRYILYLYALNARNPYESLGEGRAHRCTKLRTNKSLWHDRRAQTQLCNASALSNSIYVTVVLLSTYVVLRRGLVEECLMNNKVLLSPSFFILCISKKPGIFSVRQSDKDCRDKSFNYRYNYHYNFSATLSIS